MWRLWQVYRQSEGEGSTARVYQVKMHVGPNVYAIIETGGKQYRVSAGQVIDVDHLDAAKGSTVDLERVLLIAEGDKVVVGNPLVAGARVTATSQGEHKGEKTIVFKYKAKKRYYKKTGHRQLYTTLAIDKIVGPGLAEEARK